MGRESCTGFDMTKIAKTVSVSRPVEEVYAFWRDLQNLSRFMMHVERVTTSGKRSHWIVKAPAGTTVEWDAEITEERENELLTWRSLPGSQIENSGSVRFTKAPADRGTEVHVSLQYEPPAGKAGAALAKLFGEEPAQQLTDDLRRFKQVMETGEVMFSDGSLEGAGQGMWKQRAAQAPPQKELEASR
jgi:uncharacterized membrane protein